MDLPKLIVEVDMSTVRAVLDEVAHIVDSIDSLATPVDDGHKSQRQGELGRLMNRLGDMLALAGAEVKSEYWRLKGFSDPRDEED